MIDTAGGSTSVTVGEGAIPPSPAPHVVHLACPCPGTPHPYDVVTLRPTVTNRMGMATSTVLRLAAGDEVAMQSELGLVFLRYGISDWTFADRAGPVEIGEPVDTALIERWLPFSRGGFEVLEAANALYGEDVFRPFVRKFSTRSPDGPEPISTSATNGSGKTHRKPSKRSSGRTSDGKLSVVPIE